jgi:hypothetical protein
MGVLPAALLITRVSWDRKQRRSAPVLGRSKLRLPGDIPVFGRFALFLHCCARGPAVAQLWRGKRARSTVLFSVFLGIVLYTTGCGQRAAVQVKLQALPLPQESAIYQQIEAQIAGPTDDLQYKWFAVSGACEPQESDRPKTIFKFSEGVRIDRVSVEIWRNNERVAQSEIKVKFNDELARSQQINPPEPRIEITRIPPSEIGGPETHSTIGGKISSNGYGLPGCVVAIYVRAFGYWFIQPEAGALHKIKPDNTWGTWTHTGTKYAALLVRQDYEPLARLDMLPQTNESVLALDIVEGLTGPQATNTASGAVPSSP